MMKIIAVAGARPNFMKIAPLMHEFKKHKEIEAILVHTGQHYDENMSKLFFDDLSIPEPDIHLEVGSGTHAQQTAEIMKRFEPVLAKEKPDIVLVVGDVNSTIACALVAVKMGIKVAHVEAGLRSFDRAMPEEINRILTDAISDYLFITEKSARVNLLKEGIDKRKIHFVGNVMIDTLLQHKEKAEKSQILDELKLQKGEYAVLTLHRPSNVDDPKVFSDIMEAIAEISNHIKVIFPIHPRTRKALDLLKDSNRWPLTASRSNNIIFIDPLGYLDFLKLMSEAYLVLTDSGGMQEETTILGIPCITLRHNTERPVTVLRGTNTIVGTDKQKIVREALRKLKGSDYSRKPPKFWDGHAASRIVNILLDND